MAVGGQNTTWKHGTHGAVSSNSNYTTNTMSVSPSFNAEEADATVFGSGFRSYESTFENAEIDVTYYFDATMFAVLAAIFTGRDAVTWELGPNGTTSGYVKITGSAVMMSFNTTLGVGEIIKIVVKFRVTGAVTFTTF